MISSTISHEFKLSEIEKAGVDGELYSPPFKVIHNDVTLKFQLKLSPTSEQDKNHMGLFVFYQDGPQAKINLEFFFVITGEKRIGLLDYILNDEFEIGMGYGLHHALPRSVKALKDAGYLSSHDQILHVAAELSIKESAFARPQQIFASVSHKFDMDQCLNSTAKGARVDGSVLSVAHNNVRLDFKLYAVPYAHDNRIGFYVMYLKGPNGSVVLDLEIIAVRHRKRQSLVTLRAGKFEMDDFGRGCHSLPRTVEALRTAGYLSWDNKLHIIAELSIPQSAFAVPELKPAFVHVDLLGLHLYQEITNPADITFPSSNRVQLVSKDHQSQLWAHKEVLSCSSDVFKDLFDPNRPQTSKMDCFKQGVLEFVDLSGEALKQMMHFVYLRQSGKEFEKFALEIVPVAEQFRIKGLKEACERSLIEGMDLMSFHELNHCLEHSYTFTLPALTAACVETFPMFIQHDDIDQKLLKSLTVLALQRALGPLKSACEAKLAGILGNVHGHNPAQFLSFLSLARQYQLELLVTHCVQWFRNKYETLKASGFLRALMDENDIENGREILEFLVESLVTMHLP